MSNAIEQATFSFDTAALDPFADRMQQTFESAKPFSYAMVDGLFPPEVLEAVLDEFPEPEQVPRGDGPEERAERPVDEAERPAGKDGLRFGQRLEAVRVLPGRSAVGELVPDEPEAVDGLEVVSGGWLAVPVASARHERAREGPDRRPGRKDRGDSVEEGYESERAAANSSSKSGTSPVSYVHDPRMMPSPSTRKALRSATPSIPRYS